MTNIQLERALVLKAKIADAQREIDTLQALRTDANASVPITVSSSENKKSRIPQGIALDLIDRCINMYTTQRDGWVAEFQAL